MKSFLLLLFALVALSKASKVRGTRALAETEIAFDPDVDYCKVGENAEGENVYGSCDPAIHFPNCDEGQQFCFHRINRRDMFFEDDRQPHFFIDPRRILCVPEGIKCRTCTPGRYCLSKGRCILDDESYDGCENWW